MASQHHVAKRRADAFESLATARHKVTVRLGVDAPQAVIPAVIARDPELRAIAEIEGVAQLLESIADKLDADSNAQDDTTGDSKAAPKKSK